MTDVTPASRACRWRVVVADVEGKWRYRVIDEDVHIVDRLRVALLLVPVITVLVPKAEKLQDYNLHVG